MAWIGYSAMAVIFPSFLSFNLFSQLVWLCLCAGGVGAQIYRYKRVSNQVQRQQTKWIVYGTSMSTMVVIGLELSMLLIPSLGPGSLYHLLSWYGFVLALIPFPISIGFAVQRSCLWDLATPGAVEIEKLHLNSPALQNLKDAGVKLTVPLISQGELVGLLNLGPRISEQDFSGDDRELLNRLAIQAAPAIRFAQLARRQQMQAREQERLEQELRVARLIQHSFLPKDLPALPGWQVAAYYQPARAVGGDFYDFIFFEDGRLGIVIGDVTDKGIPAALLMTTTRTILRSVAQENMSPGKVLETTNNLLCPDMPPNMFVTCLYAILDPSTGLLRYANAGHDQPYQRKRDGVSTLWATGMPLGLMPNMTYEE